MRKKKQRKMLWGFLMGCLGALCAVTPVSAADSELLVDGSYLTNALEAESSEMLDFKVESIEECPMVLSVYLSGADTRITNAGGGKVSIYADTKAREKCDKVEVDIYLQYYSNGSWNYVNNWNYSRKNVSYLTASRTPSVTKGRYYRIKCYHAVTKNGVKESCSTATDGIPIK